MNEDFILNKEFFSEEVENYKYRLKLSYIDVITYLCDHYNVDIEDVPRLITNKLKKKIEKESRCLKLLK